MSTLTKENGGNFEMLVWSELASAETGDKSAGSLFGDRTVQVTGTFSGATLVIEGSNDGENYRTLTDPQGNALSFNAAGLETIMETPRFTRPRVIGGDGSTSINVYIHARRSMR